MKEYQNYLNGILKNGVRYEDRTGVGTTSYFGVPTMHFDLSKGFPIVTTKRVTFRWIAEELFWFISGDTNNKTLQDKGITIWNEWSDLAHTSKFGREENDLGPIYGYLWRNFGGNYPNKDGFDQLAWLMAEIKSNPNSRRLIISGWDPKNQGLVDLPPCHTLFHFKVDTIKDEQYLSCLLYQRSADSFLGVPYNISSYALLTEIMAHILEMKPGYFHHHFGDAHIYSNHYEQVSELLDREPLDLPRLEFVNTEHLVGKGLEGLLGMRYENLKLVGYKSHKKIEAPVAV